MPLDGLSKKIALRQDTTKLVLEQKRALISETDQGGLDHQDTSVSFQAEHRRLLCDHLERVRLEIYNVKEVFISYSSTGGELYSIAERVFKEFGFHPRHGDEAGVKSGDHIPSEIIKIIRQCSYFLAIWTKTYDAQTQPYRGFHGNEVGTSRGYAPSVWMPFELGVAMALKKPCKVMVEEGMQTDFLEKPDLSNSKIAFGRATFKDQLQHAKNHFEYCERQRRFFASIRDVPFGDI